EKSTDRDGVIQFKATSLLDSKFTH
ncbi:hypothetical protein CCACVL1_00620, partial [Corchorus capsularis]